jgi:hypothetical protein
MFTLFKTLDKLFQLELSNFSQEFKIRFIAEDRYIRLINTDKVINIFFIIL